MENVTKNMNRREALKRTALVMGTALSATTIAGIMQGCKADPELNWTPSFFGEPQAQFITVMSGTIIPKTATAGAIEVGVPGFIEQMVSVVYSEKQQQEFAAGLNACMQWCKEQGGDDFIYLDADRQLALAEELDRAAKAVRLGPDTARPDGELALQAADYFWEMKELTLTGFFTSEIGATQVLQYKAIPVEYHGCMPLSDVGRTWAT